MLLTKLKPCFFRGEKDRGAYRGARKVGTHLYLVLRSWVSAWRRESEGNTNGVERAIRILLNPAVTPFNVDLYRRSQSRRGGAISPSAASRSLHLHTMNGPIKLPWHTDSPNARGRRGNTGCPVARAIRASKRLDRWLGRIRRTYEGYQDFAAGGKLSCDYLSMWFSRCHGPSLAGMKRTRRGGDFETRPRRTIGRRRRKQQVEEEEEEEDEN